MKVKQTKYALYLLLFYYLIAVIVLWVVEPIHSWDHILLVAAGIRSPLGTSDFVGFHQLVWPIFVEVMIFGFIIGALFSKYNPVIAARHISAHQSNHVVVIGYNHLGRRIIDYLRAKRIDYVLLEENEEDVDELIALEAPVVVGDPIDDNNLTACNVKKAREVYILLEDTQKQIVAAEKIRKMNSACTINVRVFEDYYNAYFQSPPLNAIPFSTSSWALEVLITWLNECPNSCDPEKNGILMLGRDHLVVRMAEYILNQTTRPLVVIDPQLSLESFRGAKISSTRCHLIRDHIAQLVDLEKHVDFNAISQVYICWKESSEFTLSINLTALLAQKYPHLKIYVRIYDEELARIVERFNAKTFSTSLFAFTQLQKHVAPSSLLTIRTK
jgi:hypothetical protein